MGFPLNFKRLNFLLWMTGAFRFFLPSLSCCELSHLTKERAGGEDLGLCVSLLYHFTYINTELLGSWCSLRRNHSNSLLYHFIILGCDFSLLFMVMLTYPVPCFLFLSSLSRLQLGKRSCSRSHVANGIRKIIWIKITRREGGGESMLLHGQILSLHVGLNRFNLFTLHYVYIWRC